MKAKMIPAAACALLLLGPMDAGAKQHSTWNGYMKANRYACPGPLDTLRTARILRLGSKTYTHSGYKLQVRKPDADHQVRVGIISAIKDATPATKANLASAIDWFKQEKVEWLVVNGDLALEEFDLDEVFEILGRSSLPVLLVIGNSESRGSWSRTYRDHAKKYPNLINGVWVRQIVADDVEFWTVPGYHDKAFVRQGAGCLYKEEDLQATAALKPSGSAPVVLVAHGPPRGQGKQAIDRIHDNHNVGDKQLNELIKAAGVPFGIFGHILEAGGRAVAADMSTPVPVDTWSDHIHLNAGSLSGDPWAMLGGKTSTGMAVLLSIDKGKAKYTVRQLKPPTAN